MLAGGSFRGSFLSRADPDLSTELLPEDYRNSAAALQMLAGELSIGYTPVGVGTESEGTEVFKKKEGLRYRLHANRLFFCALSRLLCL